jgi:hypothetical protein
MARLRIIGGMSVHESRPIARLLRWLPTVQRLISLSGKGKQGAIDEIMNIMC